MKPDGTKLGIEAARLLAVADCCEIAPGLSEIELHRIEREYGFEFTDDHRAFLASGLPVSQPPEEGDTWEMPATPSATAEAELHPAAGGATAANTTADVRPADTKFSAADDPPVLFAPRGEKTT
ncbi:hypothetical protein ACFWNX_24935, partial [Streptomyces halstedii]